MCLRLVKRNDVGINLFLQKPRTFYQLSRHQEKEHMETHFAPRKALTSTKNSSSSPPLRFSAIEANRKIEKTAKKLARTDIFQHFVFQTFGKPLHSPYQQNWRMRRYNSSQVTFANSISFLEYVFFCKLKFRVFCMLFLIRNENSLDAPKRMYPKCRGRIR